MRKRRRRWWRWGTAAGVMLLLGAALTAWLMFQHIPSWYQPMEIARADLQRVRDDFVATFDGLTLAMASADRPFDYTFTQDQINAWLAAREEMWPLSREWLGPLMSDPFVAIDRGGIRLGATYRQDGVQTVASARVELQARADGVAVRLTEVAGGSLRVPQTWIRPELAKLDRTVWPAGERSKHQVGPGRLPALSELFEGAVFPNAWRWNNPRRSFRISNLKLQDGALVVTFDPDPLHAPNR